LLLRAYEGQRIHKAAQIEVFAMDRALLASLAAHLDRRMTWALSITEGQLFLDVAGQSYSGVVERLHLPEAA
jgi:uncharacterized protein YaeQ